MLKLLGDFPEVRKYIDATSPASLDPSLQGKAAYNMMWTLRNQGRLDDWDKCWETYDLRSSNYDTNWAAWIHLEDADLKTMLGDGPGARLRLASEAVQFARMVSQHNLFGIDADVCEERAAMLMNGWERDSSHRFELLYKSVNRNRSLRTPFRRASFSLSWAAAISPGPSAKRLVEKLTRRADRLTPSSMHLVISQLLKYRHSLSPRLSKDQLLTVCRKTEFGYGEALVARFFELDPSQLHLSGACEVSKRWDESRDPVLVVP
jgi:hypothetical protein